MSLLRDISPYVDGNELVTPTLATPGVKRGSDNGCLHSSRYLILLKLNYEQNDVKTIQAIKNCIDSSGYVYRAPDDTSQDAPDDYYGVISILSVLGDHTKITLPWGCMQPALLYMRGLQRGNPLARLFSVPVGLIIAFSNFFNDGQTSDRLLTWNLIQGTKQSWLCQLGSKVWDWRQSQFYGTNPSTKIASIYYSGNPVLVEYWKD